MEGNKPVASTRTAELVMAAIFLAFGALVMWDTRRLGASWGEYGPEAGYFPFYIGLLIVISSAVNIFYAMNLGERGRTAFVEWGQLKMVIFVVAPTVVYIALISNPWFGLGIYASSAIFISLFMWKVGKYGLKKIVPVSLGVVVTFFLLFEIWFKVPLPKGPIEALFGYT